MMNFMKGHILPVFDYKKSGGALMDIQCLSYPFCCGIIWRTTWISNIILVLNNILIHRVFFVLQYPHFQCVCIGGERIDRSPSFNTIQGDKRIVLCMDTVLSSLIQDCRMRSSKMMEQAY